MRLRNFWSTVVLFWLPLDTSAVVKIDLDCIGKLSTVRKVTCWMIRSWWVVNWLAFHFGIQGQGARSEEEDTECSINDALCDYPHVKVSIRDLSQISTTAPIFQQYNHFRQNLEENVTFSFYFQVRQHLLPWWSSLTDDGLIETGDWQFRMFDSSHTTSLIFYPVSSASLDGFSVLIFYRVDNFSSLLAIKHSDTINCQVKIYFQSLKNLW